MMWSTDVPQGASSVLLKDARPAPANDPAPMLMLVGVLRRHLVPVSAVRVVLADAVPGAATRPVLQFGDHLQVRQTDAATMWAGGPTEARYVLRVTEMIQLVAGGNRPISLLPHQYVGTYLMVVAHRAAAVSLIVDVARPRVATLVCLVGLGRLGKLRKRAHDVIIVTRKAE